MLSFPSLGQLLFTADTKRGIEPSPSGVPHKNVIVVSPVELCRALQCCSAAGHEGPGAEQGGRRVRCLISNYALGWKYTNKSAATLPEFISTALRSAVFCWLCFNSDIQRICTLNFV